MTEKPEEGEQTPVQQCEQCVELNEKIQAQEEKLKEVEDKIQSLQKDLSLVQDLLKPLVPNIQVLHVLVQKIPNYECDGSRCKTCKIMMTTDKFEIPSKKPQPKTEQTITCKTENLVYLSIAKSAVNNM